MVGILAASQHQVMVAFNVDSKATGIMPIVSPGDLLYFFQDSCKRCRDTDYDYSSSALGSCLTDALTYHIIHPPSFELPTSLTPSLTLLLSAALPTPPPIKFDQASTIHSYHTFLLSVARKMETVRVEASGV